MFQKWVQAVVRDTEWRPSITYQGRPEMRRGNCQRRPRSASAVTRGVPEWRTSNGQRRPPKCAQAVASGAFEYCSSNDQGRARMALTHWPNTSPNSAHAMAMGIPALCLSGGQGRIRIPLKRFAKQVTELRTSYGSGWFRIPARQLSGMPPGGARAMAMSVSE